MDTIHAAGDFESILGENKSLLAAHFRAEWAPQCKQVETSLEELAKDPSYKGLRCVNIEAESVPQVSLKYGITAVPTVVIFNQQKEVDRVNGANPAELAKKLKLQLDARGAAPVVTQEPIEERLKRLTNAAPLMVFMKGSPEEPRCGFSRTLVSILAKHNANFKHFDILSDETVRQELKKFSDWPTYPQVYKDGEFIGGLDIIKELDENGELEGMLPKKGTLQDRLSALVKTAPVMIFMKGDPQTPRCGFSKTLIEIMMETGIPFKTFDILQDEEVRQGLKEFSKWPTYPQVYVNGELIGGLDIVKELRESGELLSTLKGETPAAS